MFTPLPKGYGDDVVITCPMCHQRITIAGVRSLHYARHYERRNVRTLPCCGGVFAVYLMTENGPNRPPTLVVEPEN